MCPKSGNFEKGKENMTFEVQNGDALDLVRNIPDTSISAVITDPPYMINLKSTGNGGNKISPFADTINGAYWYAEWFKEARRILKPNGCLWTFLNWRSLVTFYKAACDIGWPIESLLIWDKGYISTGTMRGLRPSYEMVALFIMPEFKIENRGLSDIQRFKWSTYKPSGHPAEKPETLLQWLVDISTQPGDTVADLFCGSGTTGAAALKSGRSFIGIEQDTNWCKYTIERLGKIQNEMPVFDEHS